MRFLYSGLLVALCGCAAAGPPRAGVAERGVPQRSREFLHSVLWTQTSVEYRALAIQSYLRARQMLDEALSDPSRTAAVEQGGDFSALPPAVILDVDETVLDNSPYEARLVVRGEEYRLETWHEWCREARAAAVPGSVEFTRYAADRGVAVFYVTNRRQEVEEATRANLERLRFPLDPALDTIYTRGEREEWKGSNKSPRRREVASRYRVLLLVGDNLGDFLFEEGSLGERASAAEKHREHWGTRWIVLPNSQYGSWEGAVIGFNYGLPDAERLRLKVGALRTR